jgi:hypothetical protein
MSRSGPAGGFSSSQKIFPLRLIAIAAFLIFGCGIFTPAVALYCRDPATERYYPVKWAEQCPGARPVTYCWDGVAGRYYPAWNCAEDFPNEEAPWSGAQQPHPAHALKPTSVESSQGIEGDKSTAQRQLEQLKQELTRKQQELADLATGGIATTKAMAISIMSLIAAICFTLRAHVSGVSKFLIAFVVSALEFAILGNTGFNVHEVTLFEAVLFNLPFGIGIVGTIALKHHLTA